MRIPVAHLHGGEITEGAYDDSIRHAITQMASLHFVAAEPYRKRVLQLGADPESVFNVGAIGLDHLRRSPPIKLTELSTDFGFELKQPYIIATYHPVTAFDEDPVVSLQAMLEAISRIPDYQIVLTYPNADNGGRDLIPLLQQYAKSAPKRVLVIPSLGSRHYLGALAYAAAVIGNSSSGIIEAPSFGIPTVNVGKRQKGRLAASSVIHCSPTEKDILDALTLALSTGFSLSCRNVQNPYGAGNAAKSIVEILKSYKFPLLRRFNDLP